jgi:phage FluMu protein Com
VKTPVEVRCPRCGEIEDLHGSRRDDHLEIECGNCSMQWIRTPKVVCPRCGGDQVVTKSEHVLQKARGDLMSIVGSRPTSMKLASSPSIRVGCWESRPGGNG